ncbi:MAG: precorrin-3B C(17)-methyltransferase [Hyphomicrobiales bacterium]|nr:precorrin-3B C(17)-methyltransferase [Hyphomicrobiales bacterium]
MTQPGIRNLKTPHIILLNDGALGLAENIARLCDGTIEISSKRSRSSLVTFDDVGQRMRELFVNGNPIIAVMAAGAVIRLLRDVISDKQTEPPVIVVSHDGAQVVPLLGGHHGANELARKIAGSLGANAAVTTAGDVCFGLALDEPPAGYILANRQNAKNVMGALVAGAKATITGHAPWLEQSKLPIASADNSENVKLTISEKAVEAGPGELVYHPQNIILGMGCERGVSRQEAIELAEQVLAESGIASSCVAAVCSIDVKADEFAIDGVAEHFGVEARFFDAKTLELQSHRLKNPSDIVFAEVGCHGVAEGAALAGAGNDGVLLVEKTKSARVTCALARAKTPVDAKTIGRSRGTLFVVGIGPGSSEWRSPQVTSMIRASTDLVGYSLYLDLIAEISAGKVRHDFDLGREEDRVRHAMELAGTGKDVALVCSGDAGIYAMATLVFELLGDRSLSDGAGRIEIVVSPGISALQAAAARAGAPLGHDFCTISLSDLLTPWPDIQKRVKAAAEGDFVIAFYNPVSRRRRTQLAYARDRLLEHRPPQTPVILATNLGRDGEKIRVVELQDLNIDDVDMLTVVVVGSSDTRSIRTGDGNQWVYTPRGYSSKHDSQIIGDAG